MLCFYFFFLSPRPQSMYKRQYYDTFPDNKNNSSSSMSKRQFQYGNSFDNNSGRSYNRGRGQRYYSSFDQRGHNGMQNYKI